MAVLLPLVVAYFGDLNIIDAYGVRRAHAFEHAWLPFAVRQVTAGCFVPSGRPGVVMDLPVLSRSCHGR